MMKLPAWSGSTCGTLSYDAFSVMSIRGRCRNLVASVANSINDFHRARNTLSSMDTPIVALAFVCAAFALKEPEDKS
jgi:hypothetical protein